MIRIFIKNSQNASKMCNLSDSSEFCVWKSQGDPKYVSDLVNPRSESSNAQILSFITGSLRLMTIYYVTIQNYDTEGTYDPCSKF